MQPHYFRPQKHEKSGLAKNLNVQRAYAAPELLPCSPISRTSLNDAKIWSMSRDSCIDVVKVTRKHLLNRVYLARNFSTFIKFSNVECA